MIYSGLTKTLTAAIYAMLLVSTVKVSGRKGIVAEPVQLENLKEQLQMDLIPSPVGRQSRLFYNKDINTVISQAPNNTAALTFLPLYTLLFGLGG